MGSTSASSQLKSSSPALDWSGPQNTTLRWELLSELVFLEKVSEKAEPDMNVPQGHTCSKSQQLLQSARLATLREQYAWVGPISDPSQDIGVSQTPLKSFRCVHTQQHAWAWTLLTITPKVTEEKAIMAPCARVACLASAGQEMTNAANALKLPSTFSE